MRSRRVVLVLVSAVLVVSLLGCGLPSIFGSKAEPTATPAPTNTTVAPAPTATEAVVEASPTKVEQEVVEPTATTAEEEAAEPTATAAEEEAAEPTAAAATEEGGKLEVEASLDNVDSYSAVMTISSRGVDQSEDQASVLTITQEIDKANNAERGAFSGTDEDGNPVSMEVITIGQDSWMSFGEGWMHSRSNESADMGISGDEILTQGTTIIDSVDNIRLVQAGEEVNGIATDHYAWDETSMEELGGSGTASGEVWVSQEDNILIKMLLHMVGDMNDEGKDSIVDISWEILSLNQPISIQPPEGMAAEDLPPVMPGGEESDTYLVTGDMAMYDVAATAEDVVAWYDEALGADGYTKSSDESMEGIANITYTKDDVTLNLMVTDSDTEGFVSVMVSKQ